MHPTGICYQAYIPMRKEPDESVEMVSQVLFGESFSVLEMNKSRNFSLIRMHHDNYEGWINSKCVFTLTEKEWAKLSAQEVIVSHDLFNLLIPKKPAMPVLIGCGSLLRCSSSGKMIIGKTEYSIPDISANLSSNTRSNLVNFGLKLISVPYLWGGRGSFGFDCSGLCQNLYRQIGVEIPRDASMQAGFGHTLNFLEEAEPGDLAFFDNEEGKIIHVGMVLGDNKILHASGKVKTDEIDHQGIFSKEQNCYTHKLRLIKKII